MARFTKFVFLDANDHIVAKPLREWCPVSSKTLLFVNVEKSHKVWMEEAMKEDGRKKEVKKCMHTDQKGSSKSLGDGIYVSTCFVKRQTTVNVNCIISVQWHWGTKPPFPEAHHQSKLFCITIVVCLREGQMSSPKRGQLGKWLSKKVTCTSKSILKSCIINVNDGEHLKGNKA